MVDRELVFYVMLAELTGGTCVKRDAKTGGGLFAAKSLSEEARDIARISAKIILGRIGVTVPAERSPTGYRCVVPILFCSGLTDRNLSKLATVLQEHEHRQATS